MSEYIDKTFKGLNSINSNADELRQIAAAFYECGNEKMGDRLSDISSELTQATDSIRNAIAQETNDLLNQSQKGICDILEAVIFPSDKAKGEA